MSEDSSWHEAPTQGQPVVPQSRKVVVVLENASLEAARLHPYRQESKMQLLNCDEHQSILKRLGRDIADARPDIVHQCLLTLLDSPLNKSGHLEVYIHTAKGVVIRINPACRIPRTIKRFSGLMVQLLERGSISGDVEGNTKLLEIVPPPVSLYLPKNAKRIALSWNAPQVRLYKYFKDLPEGQPVVVSVGAMAKGPDTFADEYTDEKIGISSFALSASVACGKDSYMLNPTKQKPIPTLVDEVDEDELRQIIYVLPTDPRTNRVMLTSSLKGEDEDWVLAKCEAESHENQDADVHRETYEQVGVRGQIVGLVGSFYECSKKGKPKSHIKVYELQIDELIKKWPGRKKRDRRWFTLEEVLNIVSEKPYLVQSFQMTTLVNELR
ncbi:hypothetical protein INT48_003836 [Thamnidium elegans]|uniref:Nudix hydrolase domain-containing protein n=1 Tax=Thamnidium elegans TaxID=101142 RepID=A0A8H7VN01_9FUNG|nr:hypothetical protein INT48_003836 [Thamnidium elegans]